ncbi:MAG: tRNA (adenosine(37)-N6)-threonylcarbamoyltransferase complex dimerization subunit type 1 TsaB [Thermosulfidibacteraceae bacterium]|jgi:tRNA threonylcarbamoyladenosine biosynthesis protein TsaB
MGMGKYILSINTAITPIEVAISDEKGIVGSIKSYRITSTSVELFKLISYLMESKGISSRDIAVISLTVGPGSFTGIRVGFAFVRGFCYALDIPIVPITTLEAMVLSNPLPNSLVAAVIPARRGLYYASLFRYKGFTCEKLIEEGVYGEKEIERLFGRSVIISTPNSTLPFEYIKVYSVIEAVSDFARKKLKEGRVNRVWEVKPLYIRISDAEEKFGIRVT